MIQNIFSDAIELLFAISTVYFAVGFLLSVASKTTFKAQIVGAATPPQPIAPPATATTPAPVDSLDYPADRITSINPLKTSFAVAAPIVYDFSVTEAALSEINLLNQVATLPAQVLPSLSAKEADSHLDTELHNLIQIDQLSAVLKDTAPRTRKSSRSSKTQPKKSSKTAAKTQRKSASTSIPVVAANNALEINLSQCKTQKLRGVLHVDVNSLPPLPAIIKTYSVQGRFKGVRVPDLEANGFLLTSAAALKGEDSLAN